MEIKHKNGLLCVHKNGEVLICIPISPEQQADLASGVADDDNLEDLLKKLGYEETEPGHWEIPS